MAYQKLILVGLVMVGFACLCNASDYYVPRPTLPKNCGDHKVGDSFISKDCKGRCTCNAGGHIGCVSLCPPVRILCKPGHEVKYRQVPQGDGRCSCKFPYCAKEASCRMNKRVYKVGDSFILEDCKTRCTCTARGSIACVPLCPLALIRCKDDEVIKYRQVPQGNGRCSCTFPYCAKAGCRVNKRLYKVGDSFISKDCKGQCTCNAGGTISCVSLCPPFRILCKDGEVIKYRQVPQGNGRCSCRRPYCAKKPAGCLVKKRLYKVGESFISEDCKGQCTCNAGGTISCVSLCPPVAIRCQAGFVVKYRQVPQGKRCFCRRPYCAKENGY